MSRVLQAHSSLSLLALLTLSACNTKTSGPSPAARPRPAQEQSEVVSPPGAKAGSSKVRGPIQLDNISSYPRPSMSPPSRLRFDPKGESFAYLLHPKDSLINSLYLQEPKSSKATLLELAAAENVDEDSLSTEEKLRRERSRQITIGVTSFAWSPEGSALMVPSGGDLYIKAAGTTDFTKRFDSEGQGAIDPKWSPDGKKIAFVRDSELHVIDAFSDKRAKALTFRAKRRGVTHGLAEYVAQEEMDRSSGYWWSADSRWLAYTEVDNSMVPEFSVLHLAQDAKDAAKQQREDHRYPYAGHPNAKVRLGVISAKGGRTTWIDLEQSYGPDFYLARVKWLVDGELLVVLVNREQNEIELRRHDPRTGRSTVLLKEKGDPWVNLHHQLKEIEEGEDRGKLIWGSERSGFQHLYLIGRDGGVIRPLTAGPWVVTALHEVDGKTGKLWFSANKGDPTQRQLYSASLSGGPIEQVTKREGTHRIQVDSKNNRFIDHFSSISQAPVVTLRRLSDNQKLQTIYEEDPKSAQDYKLQTPRMVQIRAKDGDRLHGMIYAPDPKIWGEGPYPTIISVYGGPHAQKVRNSWKARVAMREQFLAQNGYLVFTLDNRGSANRGLKFESKIAHNLGDLEVRDQVEGVNWLVAEGLTDPKRVGIVGWSYGGYMAAMCLARAPKVFHAGIAGAPVTDWLGYDTFYTERYMGLPKNNPEGYKQSSVMQHIDKMEGRLMLVHGIVDENVHFRHTAALMNAITGARKDYDLLLYPDERHRPRRPADRFHMEKRMFDFFNRYVRDRKTPSEAASSVER